MFLIRKLIQNYREPFTLVSLESDVKLVNNVLKNLHDIVSYEPSSPYILTSFFLIYVKKLARCWLFSFPLNILLTGGWFLMKLIYLVSIRIVITFSKNLLIKRLALIISNLNSYNIDLQLILKYTYITKQLNSNIIMCQLSIFDIYVFRHGTREMNR